MSQEREKKIKTQLLFGYIIRALIIEFGLLLFSYRLTARPCPPDAIFFLQTGLSSRGTSLYKKMNYELRIEKKKYMLELICYLNLNYIMPGYFPLSIPPSPPSINIISEISFTIISLSSTDKLFMEFRFSSCWSC